MYNKHESKISNMNHCFLLIISYILLIPSILSSSLSLIEAELFYQYHEPFIEVYFGMNQIRVSLSLDLNTQHTWIIHSYNINESLKNSETIKEQIQLTLSDHSYTGKEILVNTFFNKKQSPMKFRFFLISNDDNHYLRSSGAIALPYKYIDESYSIIHQMHHDGVINYKTFAIINQGKHHKLFFGGIHSNHTINKTHSYLNVLGRDNHWDCSLSYVKAVNDTKVIELSTIPGKNDYAMFNLKEGNTYVPKAFFDMLVEKYFDDAIKINDCLMFEGGRGRYLLCLDNNYNQRGDFVFHINNYAYKIRMSSLWKCDEEYCIMTIYENINNDGWIIGTNILSYFNLLFDYEHNQIHFYSDKGINKILNDSHHLPSCFITFLLFFNIIIMSLGLCLNIIAIKYLPQS